MEHVFAVSTRPDVRSTGSLKTTREPAVESSGGGADAGQPLGRVLQLARRGHRLRRRPHQRQALRALALYDGVAEATPELVLAQLQLEAEQPLEHAPRQAVRGAPPVHGRSQAW